MEMLERLHAPTIDFGMKANIIDSFKQETPNTSTRGFF
jgi:hypothetical protein